MRWAVVVFGAGLILAVAMLSAPPAKSSAPEEKASPKLPLRKFEGAPEKSSATGAPPPATPLEERKNAALFDYLFSPEFADWVREAPEAGRALARRFSRPVPPSADEHRAIEIHVDLAERMGILKALEKISAPAVRPFLLSVVTSSAQHWLVQRQALRALLRGQENFNSEEERERVLAGLDPRVVAAAGLSDSELVERVTHGR